MFKGRVWLVVVLLILPFGLLGCVQGLIELSGGNDSQQEGISSLSLAVRSGQIIPSRIIARVAPGVDVGRVANEVAQQHRATVLHIFTSIGGFALEVPSGITPADILRDPRVTEAAFDRVITAIAPPPGKGKPKEPAEQLTPTGIDRIDAELNPTEGGHAIVVAIIDTGIDFEHPDLTANIVGGVNCVTQGRKTGCRPDGQDDNRPEGHGTHVAGVVAALDNTIDVLGVGAQLGLFAVKVLGKDGSGTFADVIAGVEFVTQNADTIQVANMSLGATCSVCVENSTDATIRAFQDAIQASVEAGVVYVVAAGNDGADAKNTVPAAYGGRGAVSTVITASALDDRNGAPDGECSDADGNSVDCFASFSNFGEDIDLIAPGVRILSTKLGGGTSALSGTSFSAPHVAGVAALYLFVNGIPAAQDLDGDGVASVGDVVTDALTTNGEAAPVGGWPGDPDSLPEPLTDGNALIVGGTGY
jgi:subtilisin family serine protease